MSTNFFQSELDQPHPERTRRILAAHPEVKSLFGRNPWTAAILLLVVCLQIGIAWGMGRLGWGYWWLSLVLGWCIGAFANHILDTIIHESTHNLIFQNRILNRWASIVADLPNTFPAAIGFRVYHLKHHAHQGDYDTDADMASRWEARLIGSSFFGKALWQLFFPFFQLARPPRLKAIKLWSAWTWANLICVIVFDAAIIFFCGANGMLYLAASFFFSVGFHPVGARWVQEHYTLDSTQETFSYYGPLNLLALNIGYHNEHHDFPVIPWNRLPRLKAMAPEFYDHLRFHRSWTLLWMQFLFDGRYNLFSRVERLRAGKMAMKDVPLSDRQNAPV